MPIITLRIDEDLLNEIEKIAKETGRKRSEVIRDILQRQLKRKKSIKEYIKLMKSGKKTGNLTLEDVEKWFEDTKPEFESWEKAIEYSRKRIR
ncbi:MAG: hypothetical protein DSY59_05890 [Persephonella sp.]|nr:MAG: hypothetical protein DSY60_03365 [Persephonella sp.]RUM58375.1 MAG: hypothetical protein DSY59_05890 [Persephonella sp.]